MANQDIAPPSYVVERDLRLDLFRGIGLWMIFLDHIPDDFVAWLTLRNYGFSDAAEFFVFISGYLAGYIGQALTLRYKPVDLDVLPLYITLIAASPLILWCLLRRPNWTLLGSVLLYIGARLFDWNLASYPPGTHWYFNPFAWQLMFVFAAWCGVGGIAQLQFLIRSRLTLIVALAWMAFAFLIVMTWHLPVLDAMVPKWMIKAIYPIDKTDLDMLRFTHFLALALVITRYFPRKSEILTSKWLRPMVLCGQHSLPIFCFGVFLSFGAHWILVQHAQGGARALWMQLLVSVGGILIMIGLAWLLERAEKVPALFVETSANLPDATNKPAAA